MAPPRFASLFKRRKPRFVDLHPLCTLRDEHHNAVRRIDELRPVRPRLRCIHHRRLDFFLWLEQFREHVRSRREFMRGRWMPVRSLAHDEKVLGSSSGGMRRHGEKEYSKGGQDAGNEFSWEGAVGCVGGVLETR